MRDVRRRAPGEEPRQTAACRVAVPEGAPTRTVRDPRQVVIGGRCLPYRMTGGSRNNDRLAMETREWTTATLEAPYVVRDGIRRQALADRSGRDNEARLIAENRRLLAIVGRHRVEARAVKARIVEAGDAERRRVERDLHDGAQQRLVSLTLALRLVRIQLGTNADPEAVATLDQACADAKSALTELRELARGIHPAVLTGSGLAAAIDGLAARSQIQAIVDTSLDVRLPQAVEAAAYFFVSEAMANVAKHAHASRIHITLAKSGNQLIVTVTDDGVGGADLRGGSGILGLCDRLDGVGGSVMIHSPRGAGTRLQATIPLPARVARD
jgi:signal transduction histidine kinase